MEWGLGNRKNNGQLIWAGSLCDGGCGIQSKVERDSVGGDTEYIQSGSE